MAKKRNKRLETHIGFTVSQEQADALDKIRTELGWNISAKMRAATQHMIDEGNALIEIGVPVPPAAGRKGATK